MLKPSTRIVIPSIGAVFSHRLRLPSAFGDWQVASLWAGFAPVPWSSSKHRSFSRFGMANSWRTQRVGSGENVQQTLVPDSWVRVNIAEPYHVPDIAELFGKMWSCSIRSNVPKTTCLTSEAWTWGVRKRLWGAQTRALFAHDQTI